jgi:hypothetical protein
MTSDCILGGKNRSMPSETLYFSIHILFKLGRNEVRKHSQFISALR